MFYSPIAWLILIIFSVQVGLGYTGIVGNFWKYQSLGSVIYSSTSVLMGGKYGLLSSMLDYLYLYIPLLTMGIMSREYSTGSIKLLYSSPISNTQIILGKYLSIVVYSIILCTILAIPILITAAIVDNVVFGLMLTMLLGVFLIILTYGAIGLFMSTMTQYQVVAAICTLVVFAFLNNVGTLLQDVQYLRNITFWLAISDRAKVFMDGLLSSNNIIYFLLIISIFLAMSIIKLRGERMKRNIGKTINSYLLIILIGVLSGVLFSIPSLRLYYDATANKINTISKESQDIIGKIDGTVTITTYSNILSQYFFKPEYENLDLKKFDNYIRFKPDIKMKYVYYWGPASSYVYTENPGKTEEELFKIQCDNEDYNPDRFISYKDIKHNISAENGNFVRVLEDEKGAISYLRKYNDMYREPFETEINAAFKAFIKKAPNIGFVVGHGERSAFEYNESSYRAFSTLRSNRNALINQGFRVKEINLDTLVDKTIDIMIISDMKNGLTENQLKNYNEFVDRGGNLLILGEPRRQDNMNPLIKRFGVEFSYGTIVKSSDGRLDNIIESNFTNNVGFISEELKNIAETGYKIMTPSVCAINIVEDKGYEIKPIMQSPSKGFWIESQSTNSLKSKVVDKEEKSNTTMLYLSKEINDVEQRVIILGDSDCISTSEIQNNRTGHFTNNSGFVKELFRNLSYDEYPVRVRRIEPLDNYINLSEVELLVYKWLLIFILPLAIIISSALILIRRNRK